MFWGNESKWVVSLEDQLFLSLNGSSRGIFLFKHDCQGARAGGAAGEATITMDDTAA
jgi:hypothetical protein